MYSPLFLIVTTIVLGGACAYAFWITRDTVKSKKAA